MNPLADDTFPAVDSHGYCLPVLAPECDSAQAVLSGAFFGSLEPWPLAQAWRAEPDHSPGHVWLGRTRQHLVIRAELIDLDIFNPETRFNAPSFLLGDVFEMFLRPPGQDAYFEFHVSPANQCLQLRIPSREVFFRQREQLIPPAWKINDWRIETATRVEPDRQRWSVGGVLPIMPLLEDRTLDMDGLWRVSFCRYDHTRGRSQPILSSTSPHAVCNFHRQEEWARVTFRPRPTKSAGLDEADVWIGPKVNL